MRRGMDAAVRDQPHHGFPGDFPPDGIESGEQHGAGGVIDQHRHAGGGFKGADVAALAADDAALDVVAGRQAMVAVVVSKVCSPA